MQVNLLQPADRAARVAALGDNTFDDLGLETLCAAMADGDDATHEAVRAVLTAPIADPEVIRYRHAVLTDCLDRTELVRNLHRIATQATEVRRWAVGPAHRAGGKLVLTLAPLTELIGILRQLRAACDRDGRAFTSRGFTELMATVATGLDEDYLDNVEAHLTAMDFEHGVQFSAGLGTGHKVADIVLHEPIRRGRFGFERRSGRAFRIIEDTQPEYDPLTELKNRALTIIADVVAEAADQVQNFFRRLRDELAFYLGCVDVHQRLIRAGLPLCLPNVHAPGAPRLRCHGLRDITLALTADHVVGNDIDADDRALIVVTGANSGGKSTFLRSLGAAQLMLQAGMFVIAESFEADVREGIFTHFVTEEDRTMSHGKLVDELVRMRGIVEAIVPNSLLLCNESFSSTSERDATRIADPLLDALLHAGVRVVFVTHLYEFAARHYQFDRPTELFLKAGHRPDGTRSFRLVPGAPEPTSHATDVFRRIFDREPAQGQ